MAEQGVRGVGKLPNIVVEKEGDGWAVRREGTTSVLSTHLDKDAAGEAGRRLARQGGVDLVLHGEDGTEESREQFEPGSVPNI